MQFKFLPSIIFILFTLFSYSQENNIIALLIPQELKENANAVVRQNNIEIDIVAFNKMIVKKHRIVTVFNKAGEKKINAVLYYDNTISIKKLEARIYNALGNEIKKIKKNDFEDVSVADGVSIFNDNRAKYFKYTAVSYPYTVEYIEETVSTTTAFIPKWYPIESYNVSTEFSSMKINNSSGIVLTFKPSNFEGYSISKMSDYHYSASNLVAIKPEAYSPTFTAFAPVLKFALQEFDMKGVKGVNTDWKTFGSWVNSDLIQDTHKLPAAVKNEILGLTANATTDIEKARIVYQFMQEKTRYISVQVGIGGWKPMLASDVDKLGYGDCKALSNYTKSLLKVVGVESYYTLIYGSKDIRNIDKTFSSQQGNHAILAVPNDDELVFLECTSQTVPFGYSANFTDDRDVLIIKPEGGEIVHTKTYRTEENLQTTKAKVVLDDSGNIKAQIDLVSEGTQYGYHEHLVRKDEKDKILFYKNYFDNINNLEIVSMSLDNNRNDIVFSEKIDVAARDYASKAGEIILLEPNMFNKKTSVPPRYRDRKLPFEIDRGYTDVDEFEITLPETLQVEALKEPVSIKNKFGEYVVSIQKNSENSLVYNRKLVINKGQYEKEDYKAFRSFCLKIVKHDKSKIALKNKS